MHHIIKEEDIEAFCPYCKADLTDREFKTELIEGITYKKTKCKCGKNLKIKINREYRNYIDGEGNLLIERIKFEEKKMNKKKK